MWGFHAVAERVSQYMLVVSLMGFVLVVTLSVACIVWHATSENNPEEDVTD